MKPEIKRIFEVLRNKTEENQKEILLECALQIGGEQWKKDVNDLAGKIEKKEPTSKGGD
jgi:hypothetical protein